MENWDIVEVSNTFNLKLYRCCKYLAKEELRYVFSDLRISIQTSDVAFSFLFFVFSLYIFIQVINIMCLVDLHPFHTVLQETLELETTGQRATTQKEQSWWNKLLTG